MVRKSTIAAAVALSLASTSAFAAPGRVAAPINDAERLGEESAWILPVAAILLVALLVAFDDNDSSDTPTSP